MEDLDLLVPGRVDDVGDLVQHSVEGLGPVEEGVLIGLGPAALKHLTGIFACRSGNAHCLLSSNGSRVTSAGQVSEYQA
ncbi:MAG: hypothetical protein CK431_24465 [Mycobacterium sp.]|nr:MAG: hypothetical protein CK431_24465 [Mycobacterium sp.]